MVDNDNFNLALDQIRSGMDPYKALASQRFQVPFEDVTEGQRFTIKARLFAAVYGGNRTLVIGKDEVQKWILSLTRK